MNWTQRISISAGLALDLALRRPGRRRGRPTCYTGCTPPAVASTSCSPADPRAEHRPVNTTAQVNGSSSLPFTGADIGELAAVGAGAVAVGVVLTRRRRNAS